jgi:hypothetical protein
MSLRYTEDVALMQPNIPTVTKGAETIVKYYRSATNEVKNLLQNECDVILECRYKDKDFGKSIEKKLSAYI